MAGNAFGRILERYGQTVAVHYGGGPVGTPVRAFLQPVTQRREDWRQEVPTPLGVRDQARFLYLGPPEVPLEGLGDGFLEWRGRRFQVRVCQPVYVGETLSHWWAVLEVRDREEDDGA